MTDQPATPRRHRRVHRAALSRIAVAGASATAMGVLVAGMGRASTAPGTVGADVPVEAAPAPPPVVVYRRVQVPVGGSAGAGTGAVIGVRSAPAAVTAPTGRTMPVTRSTAS